MRQLFEGAMLASILLAGIRAGLYSGSHSLAGDSQLNVMIFGVLLIFLVVQLVLTFMVSRQQSRLARNLLLAVLFLALPMLTGDISKMGASFDATLVGCIAILNLTCLALLLFAKDLRPALRG